MNYIRDNRVGWFTACIIVVCLFINPVVAGDNEFRIKETKWDYEKKRLQIKGVGTQGRKVVVTGSGISEPLGTATVRGEEWRVRVYNPTSVPCRVKAVQSDGRISEQAVNKAPRNCKRDDDTNSSPTANANGPYSGLTGSAVSFSSAGSADSDGSIDSYAWDFGDGSSSNMANPSHTYNSASTYTVTLNVTDNEGASASDSTKAVISDPVVNSPPTVNANGPYSGLTGSAVSFSSAGSADSDGSIDSYAWDFGDGSSSNMANPSHTYNSAANYAVTLNVTDNEGASVSDSTTAVISDPVVNSPPTVNANGPYSGLTGSAVSFSSAGSADSDGSIDSYAWDFGDGSSSNMANPSHTYNSAANYTVTLNVTDNEGASASDSTTAVISDPVVNSLPTANANGPYAENTNLAVNFSSAGSADSDGSIVSYAWDFGDGNSSNMANPSHSYTSAATYTVSLTVMDNEGATGSDTTTAVISDLPPVACTSSIQEHCEITSYTGPEVCVACHQNESLDMHGSVHYQQGGAFPEVTNIPLDFASAGKQPAQAATDLVATGINTYCGTVENSPRFTCAGCHVGNGRFPMAQSDFERLAPDSVEAHKQLANIDCLTCHQEVYKRFPDWTENGEGFTDLVLMNIMETSDGSLVHSDGDVVVRSGFSGIPNVTPGTLDFQFLPAGSDTLPAEVPMAPMSLTTLEAAQTVHKTTRQSCLNCHATSGGGDGTKRGDMSKENANPSLALDMHMSPDGENLACADCHQAVGDNGEGHRMRGRGLDLRPSDVSERFTCENSGCHSAKPHGDFSNTRGSSKDKHATKVACQTCHIPAYAKASVGTETARDWQDPHPTATACNGRGGWLPREDKGGLGTEEITPIYTWYDGTSEIYYLGESLDGVPTVPLDADVAASFAGNFNAGDPAVVLGVPNGDVTTTNTKIYPMKGHWGKLARNDQDNTLVGHSTFEFFRTGSFCRAVAVGLGLDEVNAPSSTACVGSPGDLEMPTNTTVVPVFTYQTINHGVETKGNALGGSGGCGSCHGGMSGGPLRMDMDTLGYGPRTQPSVVSNTEVTDLNGNLDNICSQCHGNETKAEDREFVEVHQRHVEKEGRECSACHDLSRPDRGLSLSRK